MFLYISSILSHSIAISLTIISIVSPVRLDQDYETPSSIKPQLQNLYGSLQTEPLAYYRNISGFFWGGWNATDLNQNASIPSTSLHYFEREDSNSSTPEIPSPPPLNSSELLKMHRGTYPWFNKEGGRTFFDINEEHIMPGNVSVIRGSLSLQSNTTLSQKVDFDVDGLHFLSYGSLYLMAFPRESPDATDPRGILGMIPSSLTNLTVSALNKSMETRIQRLNQQLLSGTENESGDSDGSSTEPLQNCTLQIYGHLTSVGGLDLIPFMDQVEHELRHPNGATFSSPIPPLQLSSVIYSPDCKFSLDSPLNRGLRSDAHQQKVVRYALVLLAVQLFQSYLITRQMDKTRTPSALAKVSYLTFVFQGVLDFFSAISHLAMGVVLQNSASMPLVSAQVARSGMDYYLVEKNGVRLELDRLLNLRLPPKASSLTPVKTNNSFSIFPSSTHSDCCRFCKHDAMLSIPSSLRSRDSQRHLGRDDTSSTSFSSSPRRGSSPCSCNRC